jgi:hypothetical protein
MSAKFLCETSLDFVTLCEIGFKTSKASPYSSIFVRVRP